MKPKAKSGRPSKYSEEIAEEICARLSKGEPLAVICRDAHMPSRQKVYEWEAVYEDLSGRIARARDEGFDSIAADCVEIADQTGRDTIVGDNGDRPDSEWIARSRLRVETRLKLLAKWCPKRYGEKIEHEVNAEHKITVRIGGTVANGS